MKIIVYHGGYGCETGCCGHYVTTAPDTFPSKDFDWDHPEMGEDYLTFAKRKVTEKYGAEHVADLDWENSFVDEY